MEHKSKGESLEKCQAELKKLRRKSQGSKHPSKYGDKEMRVSSLTPPVLLPWFSGPVIFSPVCKENIALGRFDADLRRCSLFTQCEPESAALAVLELTPTRNLLLLSVVLVEFEGVA